MQVACSELKNKNSATVATAHFLLCCFCLDLIAIDVLSLSVSLLTRLMAKQLQNCSQYK